MICTPQRRSVLAAVASSAAYLVLYPIMAHFVEGGALFGTLLVVPLVLIAWNGGERAGLAAALAGILYTDGVFSLEHFLVRHGAPSVRRLMIVVAPALMFLFLVIIVGRLGRALREKTSAENALRAAHAHLDAVLNAMPDLTYEMDRDGRIYDFRASSPDRLLFPLAQSPVGRRMQDLLPPDACAPVLQAVAEAGRRGEYRSPTFPQTRDGVTRWRELSVAPVGDHRLPDCRFIVVERDVTERKTAERSLRERDDHFENIFMNAPLGYYLSTMDGKLLVANPA